MRMEKNLDAERDMRLLQINGVRGGIVEILEGLLQHGEFHGECFKKALARQGQQFNHAVGAENAARTAQINELQQNIAEGAMQEIANTLKAWQEKRGRRDYIRNENKDVCEERVNSMKDLEQRIAEGDVEEVAASLRAMKELRLRCKSFT